MEVTAVIALVESVPALNNSKPRILFVGAFPSSEGQVFGGMVSSCQALLASTFPEHVELDLLDSSQITNPPPALYVRLVRAMFRFARFVGRFEANRPDVVFMFVSSGASIIEKGAMAWFARLRRVPAVMFPRSGAIVDACEASNFTRRWVKLSFQGARKIVCQSEVWRRFSIDQLGFAPIDVEVIRNWTATPGLLKIGQQREVRQSSPIRLVFVGWLERKKGVNDLIDACQMLHGERQFVLDIIGDGRAAAEVRARVAQYGLENVVRFRGWLRETEVHEALRKADVFVLPSWAEGLPNSMVEAMAARLAVVVSRVGAIPDIIEDRRSGLLVAPRDRESLSKALGEVIDDGELRESLAVEAYRVAIREFSVEVAVARLLEVIENVIAERDRRKDTS